MHKGQELDSKKIIRKNSVKIRDNFMDYLMDYNDKAATI